MRVSTKGRYALRIMADVAVNATDEFITLKEISERQEISDKYSEQIMNQLSKAGFVRSARGAKGGYMLAQPASEVTAGMILRVMEGSLAPVPCLDEDASTCSRTTICSTLDLWNELNSAINSVVDNYTLQMIADKYVEHSSYDYSI